MAHHFPRLRKERIFEGDGLQSLDESEARTLQGKKERKTYPRAKALINCAIYGTAEAVPFVQIVSHLQGAEWMDLRFVSGSHADSLALVRFSSEGDGLKNLREICILALYQGTTLVGPKRIEDNEGFKPWYVFRLKGTGFSPYILESR